jgi:hypothetical protein
MTAVEITAAAHAAAMHLLTLVASVERSVHAIEASDPLVGQAMTLAFDVAAQHGLPVTAVAMLGKAVLALAQAVATSTAAAACDPSKQGAA